ncbi:MAG: HTH domain-containing protein, partial [Thermoleophilia bacterium]
MSTDSTPPARREAILAALVRAGADGVSGEELAGRLGCSRAAVHRHVEALRRDGLGVEGLHGGYRLADGADPVVPSLVTPFLRPPIAGPVEWSAATGS